MKTQQILALVTLAVAASGCDKIPFLGGGPNPSETARQYWAAMAQNDLDAALQFETVTVTEGSTTTINADNDVDLTNIVVADAEADGDRAEARTTMHIAGQGMPGADLDFTTTLLRIDGEWKVDRNSTLSAMANNAMQQMLGTTVDELGQAMGEAMGQAMQGVAEGMGDAMQEAARGMGEAMDATVNRTSTFDRDLEEIPYEPEMMGTVDPGMTRDQVIAVWGEPVEERYTGNRGYLYFRNGCERSCGFFDLVILEDNQVVDAVVRGPGHDYSGISSSPPDRLPEETLPEGANPES